MLKFRQIHRKDHDTPVRWTDVWRPNINHDRYNQGHWKGARPAVAARFLKLAGSIATLMVLATGCSPDISTQSCAELTRQVIQASEEQKNPFAPVILKITEVEEISKTDTRLDCYGAARMDNGLQIGLLFRLEEDVDGDFFISYAAGRKP